jgi:DNA-binding NarL/FixJ family response regulator
MTATIGVVICDDHQILADGLAALLGAEADLDILGVTGSVAEVVQAAKELRPDVVLMDYELPDGTGIDATRRILAASHHPAVVMLTSFTDDAVLVGAIEAGANGFVTKHSSPTALAGAVRLAAAGEPVIASSLLMRLLPRLGGGAPVGITVSDREREILGLVAGGATNHEIAETLHLSPNTVRNHLARLYGRLGARSRLEAVAIAMREGVLPRR